MKKFYDCSINKLSNSLHNKESFGPIENDIMRDLGKYANYFGWERTHDYKNADLIVTNGFYPYNILEWVDKHSIPKIKRMDGIYWQNNLSHKNHIFNDAALQSDHVIFISQYSLNALYKLYSIIPEKYQIILNNVNEKIFYPIKHNNDNFTFVSSATNWNREEKRLNSIISLSKMIGDDVIRLIGKCDIDLPKNIIKEGYIENQERMNNIIANSDAFLSLFYRDAAPKVVNQGLNCGLPVLFSISGGIGELVKNNGIMITDENDIYFSDIVPELEEEELLKKYNLLKKYHKDLVDTFIKREPYLETLSQYFQIFNLYK